MKNNSTGEKFTELALTIFSTNYSDDSAVVTLSGKQGLFSLIAKGVYKAKSQLKPLLIPATLVKVEYSKYPSGTMIASSIEVVEDNSTLLSNYQSSCLILLLQELSLALYHYGDDYPTADVCYLLKALNGGSDVITIALLLVATFYKNLGIDIDTTSCVYCLKSDNIVSYSLKDGGFICKDCLSLHPSPVIDKMNLYVLKFAFMELNEKTVSKIVPRNEGIKTLVDLLENLVSYFDLKELKTLSMFLTSL